MIPGTEFQTTGTTTNYSTTQQYNYQYEYQMPTTTQTTTTTQKFFTQPLTSTTVTTSQPVTYTEQFTTSQPDYSQAFTQQTYTTTAVPTTFTTTAVPTTFTTTVPTTFTTTVPTLVSTGVGFARPQPAFRLLRQGSGISPNEQQGIVSTAMAVYQSGITPISNNTASRIKKTLGGDWIVIVYAQGKPVDFNMTCVQGNDYMYFTLDNMAYQVCRLR